MHGREAGRRAMTDDLPVETDEEYDDRRDNFWLETKDSIADDTFWADRIKGTHDNPLQRLNLALENLPLPAAFRESAVALRAMVRSKRREQHDYATELKALYELALLYSFLQPDEYCEELQEPSYNVAEAVPKSHYDPFTGDYQTLGYSQLRRLGKTDIKWLVEAWGEPQTHTTIRALQSDRYQEYIDKVKRRRERERERRLLEWDQLTANSRSKRGAGGSIPTHSSTPRTSGVPATHIDFRRVAVLILIIVAVFWILS